jgi:hypothetical protein
MVQRLEGEADEMRSFVLKKANTQWMWIAMDAQTRQVIALHVGARSRRSANYTDQLPLQPDESCGIEQALHGVHYPPPQPCAAARAISAFAGKVGSRALRALSIPATGSCVASSSPSCTSTEAWSQ